MNYDFLIVGAGLYGSVFARQAKDKGYSCLIIDQREQIGGNCATKNINGIHVHLYGPHIFHTSNKKVWDYVNQFSEFEQYEHNVIANYRGELYNLPFNLHTFYQIYGESDPEIIDKIMQKEQFRGKPTNLEEFALSRVGETLYRKLIYGYTKKQWGMEPSLLPKSIIRRLPFRFRFDNNYFNDIYQGIPLNGYKKLFENLLDGIPTELGVDFFSNRDRFKAKRIVYTGPIDRFYDYCYGKLEYRSLRFEHQTLYRESYQGCAQMNFTDDSVPHTRIIEHKFFNRKKPSEITIITKEFPDNQNEPFYPINNQENTKIHNMYRALSMSSSSKRYIFGGRLAEYQYYDMHQVVASALSTFSRFVDI